MSFIGYRQIGQNASLMSVFRHVLPFLAWKIYDNNKLKIGLAPAKSRSGGIKI